MQIEVHVSLKSTHFPHAGEKKEKEGTGDLIMKTITENFPHSVKRAKKSIYYTLEKTCVIEASSMLTLRQVA